MAKSAHVIELDAIQQSASKLLKPLGFRKSGRSFNRLMERGIVHVVNFQMGPFPIGDYVIPGIRESLYGRFAVNLGVFVPCIYHMDYRFPLPKTISDGYCSIRDRLKDENQNEWFQFGLQGVAELVVHELETAGLAFFDLFNTHDEILRYYEVNGVFPFQNPGRAALEAAVINHELGNIDIARRLFGKAFATDHKGFKEHVAGVAKRFGLTVE